MKALGANQPANVSSLAVFIQSLANEGRAVVFSEPLNPQENVLPVLQELDEAARAEAGLDLPEFSDSVALWAATMFYHLCQFTACRDIGAEQIKSTCQTPCPEKRGPATDWSADLVFHHFPRLFQLAKHLSNADPLLEEVRRLASEWPMSSVGMPGVTVTQLDTFVSHPGLRRLYVDRITAVSDVSRLGDARVDELLRADLGIHRELAPILAGKLFADV